MASSIAGRNARRIALATVVLLGLTPAGAARADLAELPRCAPPALVDTTGWRRHAVEEGISIALPPDFEEISMPAVEWQHVWQANGSRIWANGGMYHPDDSASTPERGHCRMKLDGESIDVTTHNGAPVSVVALWLSQPPGPGSVGGDSADPKDLPLIWTALLTVRVRMGFWRRIFHTHIMHP